MSSYNFTKPNLKFNRQDFNNQIKLNMSENSSQDFIQRLNQSTIEYKQGYIETLYLINDGVFAIVRKNYSSITNTNGEEIDHGDGLFNSDDGTDPATLTVPELIVKTNINPINTNLNVFIGKPCRVKVKDGIAVLAEIDTTEGVFSIFPPELVRTIRSRVTGGDLSSPDARYYFKTFGYSDEEIDNLVSFLYNSDHKEKLVTFAGEGVWTKDTNQQKEGEFIMEAPFIVVGLNKLSMKSNNCHIPTRLFSGK